MILCYNEPLWIISLQNLSSSIRGKSKSTNWMSEKKLPFETEKVIDLMGFENTVLISSSRSICMC